LDHYRGLLSLQAAGQLELPNDNFDTGEISGPGKYRLNDETHAALLEALAGQNFASAPADVRAELLDFYSQPEAPYATKGNPKAWAKVQVELQQLKQAPPPVLSTTTAVPVASGNQ
jgi:hypothetical protein